MFSRVGSFRTGMLSVVVAVVLASCMKPTADEFSITEVGKAFPNPNEVLQIYDISGNGVDQWQVAHNGLPRGDFEVGGMAASDSAIYLAINEPAEGKGGIYRLKPGNGTWELYLDPSGISYGKVNHLLYHPEDDRLYFAIHSSFYRLPADENISGGPFDQSNKDQELKLVFAAGDGKKPQSIKGVAAIADGDGTANLVVRSGVDDKSENIEFYTFAADAAVTEAGDNDGDASSVMTSTGFADANRSIDEKPHVDLFADSSGDLYYVTNYSGIFRYNGSDWSRILGFPNSHTDRDSGTAKAAVAADGTLYSSYEKNKYTQISSFFQYDDSEDNWQQIYQGQGYGTPMTAMASDGNDSAVLAYSGRFGVHIIDGAKYRSYHLPSPTHGLGLTTDEGKSVGINGVAVFNDEIFVVQNVRKGGYEAKRVLRLEARRDTRPFYTRNLELAWADYINDDNDDSDFSSGDLAQAVESTILDNGKVLAAFNLPKSPAFDEDDNFQADHGVVAVYDTSDNWSNLSFDTELSPGEVILDLDAHPGGSGFALATSTGVYWYAYDSDSDSFSREELAAYSSSKKRVDVAQDGTVVALLDNSTVGAWNASHSSITIGSHSSGYREFSRNYLEDVAVYSSADTFYVVGFDNKTLPGGAPVQVAFLEARSLSGGDWSWGRFGFDGANLSENIADTRLYHVEASAAGDVVVAGESAGTQTIFRYNGSRYSGGTSVVQLDFYNALWNSGSAHISYLGRFAADSGNFRNGQLTMTRLSDGKSNTLRAKALTIDDNKRIYLGGAANASMANRDGLLLNEQSIGPYKAADPSLLVSSGDQQGRHTWMSFNAAQDTDNAGSGSVLGLASREVSGQTVVAALVAVDDGGKVYTGSDSGSWGAIANNADPDGSSPYLVIFDADANFEVP